MNSLIAPTPNFNRKSRKSRLVNTSSNSSNSSKNENPQQLLNSYLSDLKDELESRKDKMQIETYKILQELKYMHKAILLRIGCCAALAIAVFTTL